ncbi:MAG: hypothetical protein ACYCZO_15060 [Daejeonella sp.]
MHKITAVIAMMDTLKKTAYYTVLGQVKDDGINGYGKTDYNFNLDKSIFDRASAY